MELKDQVCSLELAKRLCELGVKQKSLWWWVLHYESSINKRVWSIFQKDIDDVVNKHISAPTVAELGEMLPSIVESNLDGGSVTFELSVIKPNDEIWDVAYISVLKGKDILVEITDKSEANARAKMLIYLLENKLIEEG